MEKEFLTEAHIIHTYGTKITNHSPF